MPSARSAANQRILQRVNAFPDFDGKVLDTTGLDERDAGLAQAIDHAVAKRWLTLARVIDTRLAGRQTWDGLEAVVKTAMLSGAAQLLLMDRLPAHAVINETVEWVKGAGRQRAAGFVNAVLRKIADLRGDAQPVATTLGSWGRDELPLHDGRTLRLSDAVFAEDAKVRLAEHTAHSLELIQEWVSQRGDVVARSLAIHGLAEPPIILHQAAQQVGGAPVAQTDGSEIKPHATAGFFVLNGSRGALQRLLADQPDAIVQDPTAAMAVQQIAARFQVHGLTSKGSKGRVIVDACAGRGTKTRQLLRECEGATVIASDLDAKHIAMLHEMATRLPAAWRERLRIVEKRKLVQEWSGKADVLLLDVPCSNTGVLARRVEAKHRWSPAVAGKLAEVQRQIVADSLAVLRPEAMLVYTTCSVDRRENQDQAAWISRWHRLRIVSEREILPSGAPGGDPAEYCDGGYVAVMERKA